MNKEQTPPDGGNTGDKLLAGKYKSPEELEKAYLEAQKKITEDGERLKRAEELLTAYVGTNPPTANKPDSPPAPAGAVSDYSKILENPEGVLKKVKEDATSEALVMFNKQQQVADARREIQSVFYKQNPDLAEHQGIVTVFADEVAKTSPNLPLNQAMEQVAEKTRAYIAKIRGSGNEPPSPHVGGGGGGRKTKEEDTGEKVLTEEEILQQELKDRQTAKNKRLGLK